MPTSQSTYTVSGKLSVLTGRILMNIAMSDFVPCSAYSNILNDFYYISHLDHCKKVKFSLTFIRSSYTQIIYSVSFTLE